MTFIRSLVPHIKSIYPDIILWEIGQFCDPNQFILRGAIPQIYLIGLIKYNGLLNKLTNHIIFDNLFTISVLQFNLNNVISTFNLLSIVSIKFI